jgi:hypothetical protein
MSADHGNKCRKEVDKQHDKGDTDYPKDSAGLVALSRLREN